MAAGMAFYVLVQVVVLLGVGGSGGHKGVPYAEQSRALRMYEQLGDCQKQADALNTAKAPGHLFVCVPGAEDHR